MNKNQKIIAFFIASLLTASLTGAEIKQHKNVPELESFEFLGCSGDWAGAKPAMWRLANNGKVTFLVRHDATCGLTGKSPRVSYSEGKIDLAYTLSSPSDAVVMCQCEYWAKFTFGSNAMQLNDVTFSGKSIEHLGDWPNGL
jgi:hypothetical protein